MRHVSLNFYNTVKDLKIANMPVSDMPFVVRDIINTINITDNIDIIYIFPFGGETNEEVKDMMENIVDKFKNDNCIIVTESYLSKEDYSPDEYYDPDDRGVSDEEKKNKKPLDWNNLKIKGDILESCGFLNINDFTNLNYSIPFIYPYKNESTTRLINLMKNN